MKFSLIPVFPGTNCEKETFLWVEDNLETKVEFFDLKKHASLCAEDIDLMILPGGFSFGDYLRAGAFAARSKEMEKIKLLANEKVSILGICNGFQILCESKILPGTLIKNVTFQHHHFPVSIKIQKEYFNLHRDKKCDWIPKLSGNELEKFEDRFQDFEIPMSCGLGNWRSPINEIEKQNALSQSAIFYNTNENGSQNSVAGITNSQGNVLGLMPHPERASDSLLGSVEGLVFLYGVAQNKKIKIRKGSPLWEFTKTF